MYHSVQLPKHQTPIRAMVPPAESQNAAKLFEAINHSGADKKAVALLRCPTDIYIL